MSEIFHNSSYWLSTTLIHFVWLGLVVWVVAQFALWILDRHGPVARHRVNLLGLFAMIACVPIAASVSSSDFDGRFVAGFAGSGGFDSAERGTNATSNIEKQETLFARLPNRKPPGERIAGIDMSETELFAGSGRNHRASSQSQSTTTETANIANGNAVESATAVEATQPLGPSWITRFRKEYSGLCAGLVSGLYLIGLVLMSIRLTWMSLGSQRLFRESTETASANFRSRVSGLANQIGLRRLPDIRLTTSIATPAVTGLFKSILLVPTGLATVMNPQELDAILMHELAHLMRADHIVVWVQRAAETVLFFHPAVWSFSRGLSQTRELCCDDIVLKQCKDPMVYARGLSVVANAVCLSRQKAGLVTGVAGESHTQLVQRVRRVLGDSTRIATGPSRLALSTTLLTAICPFVLLAVFSINSNNSASPNTPSLNTTFAAAPLVASTLTQEQEKKHFISGIVVDADGKAVPNAKILYQDGAPEFLKTLADDNGNFWFSVNCDHRITACFYDSNNSAMARLDLGYLDIEQRCETPLTVQLTPAINCVVAVTKDGEPVADAETTVKTVESLSWLPTAMTDADGKATVPLPANESLKRIFSVHPVLGIGHTSTTEIQQGIFNFDIKLLKTKRRSILVLDQDDQPVPGIRVSTSLSSPKNQKSDHAFNLSGLSTMAGVTDENGRTEFAWIPAGGDYKFRAGIWSASEYRWDQRREMHESAMTRRPTGDKAEQTVYVKRRPEMIPVCGKIIGANSNLEGIKIVGRGHKQSAGFSESFESVTDKDGKFTASIARGYTYVIRASNNDWTSDLQVVANTSELDKDSWLEIPAYPATPIALTLTTGNNREPVQNARIRYNVTKRIALVSHDRRNFGAATEFRTDASGQTLIPAADGEAEIRVSHGNWSTTRKVTVIRGEPSEIEIHAAAIGKRLITGTVVPPIQNSELNVSNCQVQVFDRYYNTKIPDTKTDANGKWYRTRHAQCWSLGYKCRRQVCGTRFFK